jgi:hypothetical protein
MKIISAQPAMIPNAAHQRPGVTEALSTLLPGYTLQEGSESRGDTLIVPDHYPLGPTRRLVFVIPEGGLDEIALTHRVWQLASSAALKVLFLSLSPDQESDAELRRRLALLASALHHGDVSARASVVVGSNWLQPVKDVLHGGDLLICLAEHWVPYHAIGRRKLGDGLAATFRTPVYLLAGMQVGRSPAFLQRVHTLVAWSISIAILVVFAGLQIWLSQNTSGPLSTVLICLSIVAEGITLFKTIEWIG